MDFWSFEVTFSDILVSWGRLSTCLVPWGGLGGQTLSVPPIQGHPFGSILGLLLKPKGDMFKVVLIYRSLDHFCYRCSEDVGLLFERFLANCVLYFWKR